MDKERKISGFSLFTLWFGAAVSLTEIMTGSLMAPLGIVKGIAVIILGHLIGCLILASVGIIGFKEGKPSLVSSRISLGKYGSYMVSVFNIIQLIGWTAIMLIQCAKSIQPITEKLFGFNSFGLLVIVVGILVAIWALSADNGINVVNNIAVILLIILSLVLLGLSLKGGQVKQMTESISIGAGLELSIVMPLSWVPLVSDYTMNSRSAKGSFYGSFMGYFLGSSLMYIIGLIASVYSGTSDPTGMLLSFHMGYSALFIVILATVTTTFLDVYSAVMSTLNLMPGLSKKKLILIFTVLGILLALYFPMEQYENFLYMIGSLFAPAFSVILTDYFIYKKDRSASNFNISGIIAAVVGTSSYYILTRYDLSLGSSVPSMIITVGAYSIMRSLSNIFKLGVDKDVKQNC